MSEQRDTGDECGCGFCQGSGARVLYSIEEPADGWRDAASFGEREREKLRPIAETLAMLDGNAFFTMGEDEHWWADQYLPEAHAIYEANGGDSGWAGEASFAKPFVSRVQPEERGKGS